MATSQRSRTLSAPQPRVWELVADPHHMPRWWPGVERMEGVEDGRFTQVMLTKRGRPVRMDFQVVCTEPPWTRAWAQEIEGTPFARVLSESVIEVHLEPAGGSTQVTISQRQRLRGYSRTGGLLMRRATSGKLDEALDGLARLLG